MNNLILRYFTEHLKNTLNRAQAVAELRKKASPKVELVDVIRALAEEKGGVGSILLNTLSALKDEKYIEKLNLKKNDAKPNKSIPLSKEVYKTVVGAIRIAQQFQFPYVGTEHLLFAILENPDQDSLKILAKNRDEFKNLIDQIKRIISKDEIFPNEPIIFIGKQEKNNGINQDNKKPPEENMDNQNFLQDILSEVGEIFSSFIDNKTRNKESETPYFPTRPMGRPTFGAVSSQYQNDIRLLDYFARDMNKEAMEGTIDPIVGRDEEIERIIRILMRKTKNNPVLVGEPGVGKTAIVAGLAFRLLEKDIPPSLLGKKIMNLDLSLLVAGTTFRGEFEDRFKRVIEEAERDPSVILFIDELHNIVGAGSAMGSLDAANIVKPALARGQMRCVGATTSDEYQRYIERDGALERRFQPVWIREPSVSETVKVLRGIRKFYEEHHQVKIANRSISQIANLADRYITDRCFPDKAIDLLDETAAYVIQNEHQRGVLSQLQKLEGQREKLNRLKERAVDNNNFKFIEPILRNEQDLKTAILHLEKKILQEKKIVPVVGEKDVAEVLAKKLNIPSGLFLRSTAEKLNKLPKNLKKSIQGQDKVIQKVCSSLKRQFSGIVDPERPAVAFLFVGPTGIGKTYLAKLLSREIFLREDSLVRVDMSEFSEKHTISRLLGSPPGYVGYGENNSFTDKIRKNPYSLILFDEIEKAHPEVFHILLQVLEDGFLTDGMGRKINFKNAIIVFTSNLGNDELAKNLMGFTSGEGKNKMSKMREWSIKNKLEEFLKPEFLSRLTDIVYFNSLGEKELAEIVRLEFKKLNDRIAKSYKVKINASLEVFRALAKRAINHKEGARAVRRELQIKIEEPLAQAILEGKVAPKNIVKFSLNKSSEIQMGVMKKKFMAKLLNC